MFIISHETRTRYTKLSLGKYIRTVKRKKLQDPELWPLTLIVADKDLKIGVYFNVRESCHDTNRFELKINDVKYLDLPYEAPWYDPEMEDTEHIKACIMVNGAQAFNNEMPWYSDIMQEKIDINEILPSFLAPSNFVNSQVLFCKC